MTKHSTGRKREKKNKLIILPLKHVSIESLFMFLQTLYNVINHILLKKQETKEVKWFVQLHTAKRSRDKV